MLWSLDTIIIIIFLILNLGVGIYYSTNIKNLKEYAVGKRNFSTAVLTSTIIATWISGSFFTITISETYSVGIWIIVVGLGHSACLLITGLVLGPRMGKFFGAISVAECMGNIYGKRVRIITAIASVTKAISGVGAQVAVFSTIFKFFFGVAGIKATIISSFIVIIYSAAGGIRSVTFTDVIQFFTFRIVIPLFALFVWGVFGNIEQIVEAFQNHPNLDPAQLIDPTHPKFPYYFALTLYSLLPGLNPTMFQRILMAKDVKQITYSFTTAAGICFVLHMLCASIGVLILINNADLDPNNIVMYILDKYSFTGLKGITAVGIIAILMSTADSWINTGAVIFTNDILKPLGLKTTARYELLLSRLFAGFIGGAAMILALAVPNILNLVLLSANFYLPIVTVPLLLEVFGLRSNSKVVLIGMVCGALTSILWRKYIMLKINIESVIPGMGMNLVSFLVAHLIIGPKKTANIKRYGKSL